MSPDWQNSCRLQTAPDRVSTRRSNVSFGEFRLFVGAGIMWSRIRSGYKGAVPGGFAANSDSPTAGNAASPEMQLTAPPNRQSERALVNAVLPGEAVAARRFLEHTSATLWSIVVRLEGDGSD